MTTKQQDNGLKKWTEFSFNSQILPVEKLTSKCTDVTIVNLQHKVSDAGVTPNFESDIWKDSRSPKALAVRLIRFSAESNYSGAG